jgi:hypothetical protein
LDASACLGGRCCADFLFDVDVDMMVHGDMPFLLKLFEPLANVYTISHFFLRDTYLMFQQKSLGLVIYVKQPNLLGFVS